ncbi:iron ABC transporter permease [Paenibacillus cellulosilyticus]|nr:iron ABC transporter permease [Paenibacillus cellulosilyticus]QKS46362.1 iron ABC transporter permease [Paenibacillus cellulosilyticus]
MMRKIISFTITILLLLAVIIWSVSAGSIKLGLFDLIHGLITGDNEEAAVIRDLRFPRIIVALLTGATLAVSGALLQAVLRNPLADAGVIGISSGAGFVSVLMVTIFPTVFFWMPMFSFLGGVLAFFLVYSLSWKSGLTPTRLLLVGVAINATFSGLGQSFNYRGSYAVTSVNQAISSIFTMKTWTDVHVLGLYGSIGLLLSLLVIPWCNVLALQDKTAGSLGMRVARTRIVISIIAVLLASVATAVGGLISFVGLLIPHITRLLVGSDHKLVIPFSMLAGALLVLAADTLGRTVVAPTEVPASIILTVIGGPFLVFMLRKWGREYGA